MRAVAQHNLQKVAGFLRGVNGAAKALLVKQRQIAGMINMGVRYQRAHNILCRHRQGLVFKAVYALLHAAIYKKRTAVYGQKGLAAGHFARRPKKFHTHALTLLFLFKL